MTVSADEFIRGFLLHVLPHKYVKITNNSLAKLTTPELILKITGLDINLCPCCKKGKLIIKEKLLPKTYSSLGKTK